MRKKRRVESWIGNEFMVRGREYIFNKCIDIYISLSVSLELFFMLYCIKIIKLYFLVVFLMLINIEIF